MIKIPRFLLCLFGIALRRQAVEPKRHARIESMNNKIKLTIRMGYGFRNIDNLIALIMLRCSDLQPQSPGRIAA